MTRTPEEMDAAITTLLENFGDPTKNIDAWRPVRPPERPNGFYGVWKSMAQLFDSENALNRWLDWLTTRLILVEKKISAIITPAPPSSGSVGPVFLPEFGWGFHFKDGDWECLIFISKFDYSMRILTNHKDNDDGGFTHAIETMAQQRIDIERFGIGMSYWPPRRKKNADGTPGGLMDLTTLDKEGGKGIVFRPGGQDEDGHRGPYAQMYAGLPGQGLQIGVSSTKANSMDSPSITIERDGSVHTR